MTMVDAPKFQPQSVSITGTISPVVIVETAGQEAPSNIIDRTKPSLYELRLVSADL